MSDEWSCPAACQPLPNSCCPAALLLPCLRPAHGKAALLITCYLLSAAGAYRMLHALLYHRAAKHSQRPSTKG
jgi:hypothetical protein